ncbi:CBO0543 family protein [Metabacillus sediminilitoris]|uniref:CBO0543 family protein n=1 Tax=Metabacillus sediminilitoris TaxID=2567941 RepID=UPI001D0DA6F4|nr:CBO0543 family protein [Metabacillus sediminilitoris]
MKNTVKRLKKLNSQLSQKKRSFLERNKKLNNYLFIALFSSFVGTYLDLMFVGMGKYAFPTRLFPEIFSINIVFTLFILPLFSIFFLIVANRIQPFARYVMIIMLGVVISVIEKISEHFGWFIHLSEWNHAYSIFGYIIFFIVIWKLYLLLQRT